MDVDHRGLPGLASPDNQLRRLSAELSGRFAGIFGAETIERYVLESYDSLFRAATVKAHLISRTSRFATDRLSALAQAEGVIVRDRPEVLFVCERNAGRSHIAALLTDLLSGGAVHVRSAGSAPAAELDPTVALALAERGIDAGLEFPKPLTDDVVRAADVVITMGCGDACPIYPGKRYEDWSLADPEGRSLEEVRAITEEIAERVRELLASLGIAAVTP